jgi:hypothetical protein
LLNRSSDRFIRTLLASPFGPFPEVMIPPDRKAHDD